ALQRRRRAAARARVDVVRLEALAHDALEEEALLVGRLAADDRAAPTGRALEPRRGLAERALPRDGPQLAAVADHRARDALVDVDGLVGEAALVAEPAVVHRGVVAPEHAQDALVADREAHVALRRAEGAD